MLPPQRAQALDNGLALTPPLGWSTFNTFDCYFTESDIKAQADAMVSSGMKDAGYQYINMDACWGHRDASTGMFVAESQQFPNGIKPVADYVHGKGLKLGIYITAGTGDCGNSSSNYGSQGHETSDAQQFADWGIDFVKDDFCSATNQKQRYIDFRNAISATGRNMVFSINPGWSGEDSSQWTNPAIEDIANMTRVTPDINACWSCNATGTSVLGAFDTAADSKWNSHQKAGHFIDVELLEVGVTKSGQTPLTYEENKSHLSMWSMLTAPLIAGNDLTTMSTDIKNLYTNADVLAVDQDITARATKVSEASTGLQVWSKRLSMSGTWAVMLFNRTGSSASITANFADLGLTGSVSVRDLWAKTDRGAFTNSYTATVPAHGVVLIKASGTEGGALVDGNTYEFDNVNSGKALGISGKSTADGAYANQYTWLSDSSQKWVAHSAGSGYWYFTNANGGKALSIDGSSTADDARVNQWSYFSGSAQQWTVSAVGSGAYQFINRNSGKALGIRDSSTANDAVVNQYTDYSVNSQKWTITSR